MQKEVSHALQGLLGKAMWTCRRAADMSTFQFGRRVLVQTFDGRPAEVGEYSLHVQCGWRIVKRDTVIVGSRDLYYPADYTNSDSVPEAFNWDRDPNRRDKLLVSLFEGQQFTVRSVHAGPAGMCRIEFGGDIALELFPDHSLSAEHWRFFAAEGDGGEIVFSGPPLST